MFSAHFPLSVLLALATMIWGWNAGMFTSRMVPNSVEIPGALVSCGPDCRAG
jgi:hypothetical protein